MIAIKKFILLALLVVGFSFVQAESFEEFRDRMADWEGFVLDELPTFGEYDSSNEQKCLEHLAKKGVFTNTSILVHRVIDLRELNERIKVGGDASFAHNLRYYLGRSTLIARDEGKSITFLFSFPEAHLKHLWCFARKVKS